MLSCHAQHLTSPHTVQGPMGHAARRPTCDSAFRQPLWPPVVKVRNHSLRYRNGRRHHGSSLLALSVRIKPRTIRRSSCVRACEVLRVARQHRMMAESAQCPRFHRHASSAGCTSLGTWLLADACTRTSSQAPQPLQIEPWDTCVAVPRRAPITCWPTAMPGMSQQSVIHLMT